MRVFDRMLGLGALGVGVSFWQLFFKKKKSCKISYLF